MPRHIRKGDNVIVQTGKDKGRSGEVLQVITDKDNPDAERVLVKGINTRTKHIKPSQSNPQGGTITLEMSIHISNVSPVDSNGKGTRVRYETKADGSKVRLAATTGQQLGPDLKKAK